MKTASDASLPIINDFGSIAVDASSGKLIVATAGNHLRPGTYLTVLDF